MGVLFPEQTSPRVNSSKYCTSPEFTAAVIEARFAMTFGIIALVGAALLMVGPGLLIGVAIAVIGYGKGRFYKTLGGVLIGLAILGFAGRWIDPLVSVFMGILTTWALGGAVFWKAAGLLRLLKREGQGDPDWAKSRTRSTVGLVTAALSVAISLIWGLIGLLAVIVKFLAKSSTIQ